MPQFNEYTDKTELSDSDISVLYDASSRTTKRFSFLNISRYVLAKLSTRLFTNLSTEDKTIPGAINEVNTKAAKIDDFVANGMDGATVKVKAYGNGDKFSLWSDEVTIYRFDF